MGSLFKTYHFLLDKYPGLLNFIFKFLSFFSFNRFSRKFKLINHGAYLKKNKSYGSGFGNKIIIDETSYLDSCVFYFSGNNNIVHIKKGSRIFGVTFYIEDDGNKIVVGNRTTMYQNTEIAAIEGTEITIGDTCLFSSNIRFRTGDSHAIYNKNNNERINYSKSIEVCNRVWIGTNVMVLKGSKISQDSIVGTGSIVTKKFENPNCIIAGNPAKIIRDNVYWQSQRSES